MIRITWSGSLSSGPPTMASDQEVISYNEYMYMVRIYSTKFSPNEAKIRTGAIGRAGWKIQVAACMLGVHTKLQKCPY